MSCSPKARIEEYANDLEAFSPTHFSGLSAEGVERGRQRIALLKSIIPVMRALTEQEAESLLRDGEIPGRISELANAAGVPVEDCRLVLGWVASTLACSEPPRTSSPCCSDPEAKRTLDAARRIAAEEWRHEYVGSEHLLLALLNDEDEVPRLLHELGVLPNELKDAVTGEMPRLDEPVRAATLPMAPRLKNALVLAEAEAVRAGGSDLRPRHLLLGLIREGMSPAGKQLSACGVTMEAARGAASHLRDVP